MKGRAFGSLVVALALLGSTYVELPRAQTQIQRGYGPTIAAGSGGATAGISSVLTVSTTTAQTTANTTETDLWTYSLPANTLSADRYGVRIRAFGTFAANANNKTVRLYFGATVLVSNVFATNNGGWEAVAVVLRSGASAQVADGNAQSASSIGTQRTTEPAENTAGAVVIKATGQNAVASAGDIVFKGAVVEFLRAGS